MALAIRRAWYLANLIFEAVSAPRGPQIWHNSKKVAEAEKVSAVCLRGREPVSVYKIRKRLIDNDYLDALFAFIALSAR